MGCDLHLCFKSDTLAEPERTQGGGGQLLRCSLLWEEDEAVNKVAF